MIVTREQIMAAIRQGHADIQEIGDHLGVGVWWLREPLASMEADGLISSSDGGGVVRYRVEQRRAA
ncbi:hypothetical protein Drose_06035 [Dactylosporangium roseum]|uniref:Uncharacterized protein n=1 Tax=Dactylosporangium roseum TaxID=47989 RepID=A0ABY5Z8E2_9ACTN|nr:hypothetical protein [Dactylosporangium roseum]UWZ37831.1 hypothetical protein Drose_06035 [Dactylosporangium roseum]